MARARHETEAPFREAEIARKVALLESRTAQDVALMEANGKLRQAGLKAKGDKAAARGKVDADRMKSSGSGLGADKGGSKAGGGSGSSRGGGGGSSRNGSGGPDRHGSRRGGTNSGGGGGRSGPKSPRDGGGPKDRTKGPERSSGSRSGGSTHNGATGGGKGSQSGSGGSGRSRASDGGGRVPDPHRPGDRPWRDRDGRSKKPLAGVGPWKDLPENKNSGAGKSSGPKADTAKNKSGRLPAGTVIDPHKPGERPWKTRPTTDTTNDTTSKDKTGGQEKPDRSKGTAGKTKDTPEEAPESASDGPTGSPTSDEPDGTGTAAPGSSDGSETDEPGARNGRSGEAKGGGSRDRWRKRHERRGERPEEPTGPVPADSVGITVERVDREAADTPGGGPTGDPRPVTTGARGLPPAPEPTFPRPGTTRDTKTKEDSVSNTVTTVSGRHRTDITFDEYLMEMANIALQAASHQERAEALTEALGRVATALRDMAASLADDHNVDLRVTDQITDLADAAGRMKTQATRCAEECGIALEAAKLAAAMVARVYGQDMDAKDDAGLKATSAAAHHD
ncbi:ATP/GTP-binding protein [Streptomyces sp. URMC 125]|uniref:ATP/GTP-binding protein n=1 Tax=Streptomyces sp. URMC 125 TaxID=3423419 RepID=UPI003F1CFF97